MNTPTLYPSWGAIRYETDRGYRLVVSDLDSGLVKLYRHLIPFWMPAQPQKYSPHITVVRIGRETPKDMSAWGKHEGEPIEFQYEPKVYWDHKYYWLNIWCPRLEELRDELGLPVTSPFTVPPDGFRKCFHCTIANRKHAIA